MQRVRTCQTHIDHEGLSQQSLVINTPKFHKHYILPGNSSYILLLILVSVFYMFCFCEVQSQDHSLLCTKYRESNVIGYSCYFSMFIPYRVLHRDSDIFSILCYVQLKRSCMVRTSLKPDTKRVFQIVKITGMELRMVECISLYLLISSIFSRIFSW